MPESLPLCPDCASDLAYEMGSLLVCPMCAHEWAPADAASDEQAAERVVRDAMGTVLTDGDTVSILKDLKVTGASGNVLKVGTKVRNIRLIDGVGDHDIDCKIDGFGSMQLKSSVVKKV